MWKLFEAAIAQPLVLPFVFWGSIVAYIALQSYMLLRECSFLARILGALPLMLTLPFVVLASLGQGGIAGFYMIIPTILLSGGAALYLVALWAFPRVVEWLVNHLP